MFGLVVGLGNGFGYATPVPVASKWFPDKRGLVVGIMVGGYGPDRPSLVPWRLLSSAASAGGRRSDPGRRVLCDGHDRRLAAREPTAGYQPPGWTPPQSGAAASVKRDYSPSEMVRTRTFALLWVAYCLGVTAGLMVISQLVPFALAAGLSAGGGDFRDHHWRGR